MLMCMFSLLASTLVQQTQSFTFTLDARVAAATPLLCDLCVAGRL